MSVKINRWIPALIAASLLMVFATAFDTPTRAFAAQPANLPANTCLTCHENLYYLYDSGKLYCITDQAERCVNCHEGNATVMKEEEAHVGLVLHPQENNGQKCLECHTSEITQDRLAIFASEGGFKTSIKADAYVPAVETITVFQTHQKRIPSLKTGNGWRTSQFLWGYG